jgi:uncharacterized cupredoxin-like copper-binding protein
LRLQHPRLFIITIATALFATVLGSCAAEDPLLEETTMAEDMANMNAEDMADMNTEEHMDEGDHAEFAFGEPADAADADRVIEVTALDSLQFDPTTITIEAGETVTFRVTNGGALPHDFTLGDQAMQEEHEAEMAEMAGSEMMMHNEPNVFSLESGETKEMTWHITEPGEILIGCHQPGHYAAGMKASVMIEG